MPFVLKKYFQEEYLLIAKWLLDTYNNLYSFFLKPESYIDICLVIKGLKLG